LVASARIGAYQKGRTGRERAKHFDDLKGQVLEPMIAHLTGEITPILEHRMGSVEICAAHVPQPTASVMDSSTTLKEIF
jgi:hypothetical protein